MSSGSTARARALPLLALVAALAGCPGPADPTRDGGTPCTSESDCNPAGVVCGSVFQCIHDPNASTGVCAVSPEVRACADGVGYPDSSIMQGDCLEYQDCNPEENTCGLLIACNNFRCDSTATLAIPCPDAGVDGSDASADASDAFDATTSDF